MNVQNNLDFVAPQPILISSSLVGEIIPRTSRSTITITKIFNENLQYSTDLFHYAEVALFRKLKYQLYQIYGDGNCLFRALAHQMDHNQDSHCVVRAQITQEILQNSEKYLDFFKDEKELKSYVEMMKKNGEYGDGICVSIFCILNNCKVTIYRSAVNLDERIESGDGEKNVYLYYDERIKHYSSLKLLD